MLVAVEGGGRESELWERLMCLSLLGVEGAREALRGRFGNDQV